MLGKVSRVSELGEKIKQKVQEVIVGKDSVIELLLVSLLAGGHVLIEDIPGVGKTMLARAFAASLGLSFKRIQFTPDLLPSDVLGINYYNQKTGDFEFREGPIMANLILADEINRATPRTQSGLLESMEEHQITIDGVTRKLPEPFMVIATQNPIEQEGTFPLPEAQLDRFLIRIQMGYPSGREEKIIMERFGSDSPLKYIKPVARHCKIVDLQSICSSVHVSEPVKDYILNIITATRRCKEIKLGASPRASLALYKCSKILAALKGREYVVPDDVKSLVHPILEHRIILTSRSYLKQQSVKEVLNDVIKSVEVPTENPGEWEVG
jgi:MoxR-like ATPase